MHKHNDRQAANEGRNAQSWVVVFLATLIGAVAFLYPFVLPVIEPAPEQRARATEAPLLFALVTLLCLVAIVIELDPVRAGTNSVSASKVVALLGVLVAADAALRLLPTFLGASPLFALIILVGAVFGPVFGFQMGALTLLVSAFLTGGIGPWLPFQMLGAGWIGMAAGWLPAPVDERRRLIGLAVFGGAAGFAYGALLNLWSWPFAAPGLQADTGLYWNSSLSTTEAAAHYARFYLVTSLWYDAFRAVANVVLILVLGGPVMRTLLRSKRRFSWRSWTLDQTDEGAPTL